MGDMVQFPRRKPRKRPLARMILAAAIAAGATTYGFHLYRTGALDGLASALPAAPALAGPLKDAVAAIGLRPGCTIKGNVSPSTSERIYHVQGQGYYHATRISPLWGERYFCSEAEARRAGWRRSRI